MKTKRNEFAAYIESIINDSDKTQHDIASEIGYDNANIITMFKKGSTRVPLEKIVPLARVLDLEPGDLVHRWFDAYMPEAKDALAACNLITVTRSEKSWVTGLRTAFPTVPPFDARWTPEIKNMASVAVV